MCKSPGIYIFEVENKRTLIWEPVLNELVTLDQDALYVIYEPSMWVIKPLIGALYGKSQVTQKSAYTR